jgi:branched-chain amino acid transport system ATP-binding protein
MTPLLQLSGVDVHYGDFQALYGIDLRVDPGETLAVLGANGAGKSTLLRTVAGLLKPTRGTVQLDGGDITRVPAHHRVRQGVALTPEGRTASGPGRGPSRRCTTPSRSWRTARPAGARSCPAASSRQLR